MTKIIATLVMLLSFSGMSGAQQTPPIDVSGLSEASMGFDQEAVGPYLAALSRSDTLGKAANGAIGRKLPPQKANSPQ